MTGNQLVCEFCLIGTKRPLCNWSRNRQKGEKKMSESTIQEFPNQTCCTAQHGTHKLQASCVELPNAMMIWVGPANTKEAYCSSLVATVPYGEETASSHCLGSNDEYMQGVCAALARKLKKLLLISADTKQLDLSDPNLRAAVIKIVRKAAGKE
eukprot:gb/GECG01011737.1/.p1 GENE.gb/GECG01011737.1/~~gb/GECG01011737.1/.p1  ORF type:complete len:154 (+),score=17.87 gb/GECG01011737.1/:1-462(+)